VATRAGVLVAPRAVFVALRDDSDEAIEARQEPLNAIIGLAGFAGVLATPVARHLLNDPSASLSLIPVWVFLGGAAYAVAVYWLGGGLLYGAARRFGGLGSFRRARSVLALSSAPLALALFTLWPIRIAIYGQNLFRTGGDDWGPGDRTFGGLLYSRSPGARSCSSSASAACTAGAGPDRWRQSGSRQRSRPWWSSPQPSRGGSSRNLSDLVTDCYKVFRRPSNLQRRTAPLKPCRT
jgi:hypothetical protein